MRCLLLVLALVLTQSTIAILPAADKATLQAAFTARAVQVATAKNTGALGETIAGLLAVPNGGTAEPMVADLMAKENADRQELYRLLAAETGATPEVVAERNAKRNYQAATPGTWLQKKDGTWAKK